MLDLLLVALIMANLLALGCAGKKKPPLAVTRDFGAAPTDKNMILSYTSFALKLFTASSILNKNFVFSPISIGSALAMLHEGASGVTRKEIADLLGTGFNPDSITLFYSDVLSSIFPATSDSFVFKSYANVFAVDKRVPVRREFVKNLTKSLKADIDCLDFRNGKASAKYVNNLIAQVTENRLGNVVEKAAFENAVALIASCFYFKADWKTKFSPHCTKPASFMGVEGNRTFRADNNETTFNESSQLPTELCSVAVLSLPTVDFMSQIIDDCLYSINAERIVFEIDSTCNKAVDIANEEYAAKNPEYSMVIIMPSCNFGNWKTKLTAEALHNDFNSMHCGEVQVTMPKFAISESLECKSILEGLGVRSCFSSAANFTGMIEKDNGIFISDVIHKDMIEVNEEGTVAGAATVQFADAGISEPIHITLDQPFLFALVHKGSTPHFMGQVV